MKAKLPAGDDSAPSSSSRKRARGGDAGVQESRALTIPTKKARRVPPDDFVAPLPPSIVPPSSSSTPSIVSSQSSSDASGRLDVLDRMNIPRSVGPYYMNTMRGPTPTPMAARQHIVDSPPDTEHPPVVFTGLRISRYFTSIAAPSGTSQGSNHPSHPISQPTLYVRAA